MLEARELRMGNTIECYLGAPISESMEIIVKATTLVNFDKYPKTSYHPIPLTEEWLVKFGFVKSGVFYESKGNSLAIKIWGDETLVEYIVFWGQTATKSYIDHVHQLQNLYFALTGEELTIK